ncbi:nucleobindin-2-like isoform X1 [Watersipora subatra]|uniref:nucleobindin-2-like isoform X1 n=1 Tax=Watersipora subatra TaxID=2589382 RepID=UPI00355C9C76
MYKVALVCATFLVVSLGAPVNPGPNIPEVKEGTDPMGENFMSLEYKKYLEEVVQLLESDEAFKNELEKMEADKDNDSNLLVLKYREYLNQTIYILEEDQQFRRLVSNITEEDVKTGQIAHYLQFANKNTRTKLDELKRMEVRRLRDLHKKLTQEAANEIRAGNRHPQDLPNVDTAHIDHENPHTFEIEDLKKLIKKTTDDLSDVDKKRKEEFKKYEMNKEHEYREQLKHAADQEAADQLKKEHEEKLKRHKDHPKMHHPGNKAQLQEVWEEEDDLDPEQFDPKVFFGLHDIDGDGYLSTPEIEALFQLELDKVYNSTNPDDDMVERDEEMNRMREHVFGEIDTDRDGFVSLAEFIESTKSEDFDNDDAWGGLSSEEDYDSSEFDEYEKALAEQERLLQQKHNPNEETEGAGAVHDNIQNEVPAIPVEAVETENADQPADVGNQ